MTKPEGNPQGMLDRIRYLSQEEARRIGCAGRVARRFTFGLWPPNSQEYREALAKARQQNISPREIGVAAGGIKVRKKKPGDVRDPEIRDFLDIDKGEKKE